MSLANKSSNAVELRAAGALPAAGAFEDVADATTLDTRGCSFVGLLCKYTRGAVGGAAKLRVYDSADGTVWHARCVLDASSYTSGELDAHTFAIKLPVSAGANEEQHSFSVDVALARYVRFTAAEYGVAGTPGTLAVSAVTGASP